MIGDITTLTTTSTSPKIPNHYCFVRCSKCGHIFGKWINKDLIDDQRRDDHIKYPTILPAPFFYYIDTHFREKHESHYGSNTLSNDRFNSYRIIYCNFDNYTDIEI